MRLPLCLLLSGALALPCMVLSAQAQEQHASPMNQEYHQQMSRMHDEMMAAMNEQDPDRAFARGMLAHHIGAVEMAQTQLKYGKDPEMRRLAESVIAAQQQEINQMKAWLKAHPAK
ncbi:DUF305 domain-containing protein [Enterobacteriaceae bacterium BIT-l23]|uniref:CopM family metallochaperone n=1 Tax=Jejubacter sp. L23 TaxID=3092086 RepID=UPI001584E3EF|nr:DUF305 domain-containing protein [Enterobacteriaceae bacterium BIT-l23]